jgi:hypothetical protein
VVDGISSTMAWCLWWRVYAGRASPTRARWKKIGKDLVKLEQEKATGETALRRLELNQIHPHALVYSFYKTHRDDLQGKAIALCVNSTLPSINLIDVSAQAREARSGANAP